MLENLENKATRGSISQIILKALSFGDKYGYEICKEIEKLSNGKYILKQPSLYSCLRRMEEQKLISSYWKDSLLGGRRHYYSITKKGEQVYQDNKQNWKDDNDLLNSLPDAKSDKTINVKNDNDNKKEDKLTISTTSLSPSNKNSIFVLEQENLFNLVRKKDEIKKINSNNDNEEDKNKSFLQFDFFEQNIKVIKKNTDINKDDINSYSNKYSDLDNHSQDIEPTTNKENELDSNLDSNVKLSSLIDKEIKRNELSSNLNKEPKDDSFNIFSYMKKIDKSDDNGNENTKNIHDFNLDNKITPINKEYDNMEDIKHNVVNRENIDSKPVISDNFEDVSWEKSGYGDAPLFNHDYKSAIGKLYNNSQLKDPYEQNKFQSFKEIFPSSTLEEREKTEIKQTKIDAVIQSSSNSNIDCDDIVMLNNLYNLQGLNIKIHDNNENKRQNKIYRDRNKLNMICAWIISFLGLAEILITYLLLNKNNLYLHSQMIVYICCSVVLISIGIIFSIKNTFDRYKLMVINKKFTKDLIVSILSFILLIVATFAVNIILGMNNLDQVEYLSFWLIPCLLFSNLILTQGIYALLLKMKFFNS